MYVMVVWVCWIGGASCGILLCDGGRLGARGSYGVGHGNTIL